MANTSERQNAHPLRPSNALVTALCLLAALLAPHTPAVEPAARQRRPPVRYAIVPLGPPLTAEGTWYEHLVINDRGQIAANLEDREGHEHAHLWKNGTLTPLPGLGGNTRVAAINNRGQVAGEADTREGHGHAVLWQGGHLRDLGTLGSADSMTADINDSGEVVGTLLLSGGGSRGFIFRRGRMARIRVQKGLVVVSASAINNHSVIVGRAAPTGADASTSTRVWLIQHGQAVCRGPLKDASQDNEPVKLNDTEMVVGNSYALESVTPYTIIHGKYQEWGQDFYCDVSAVNNRGQYVGTRCAGSVIQDGPFRAVLWQAGRRYDLNELIPTGTGWELMHATGINNRGVIIGTGAYHDEMRAFKLIPLRSTHARAGESPLRSSGPHASARRLRRE